MWPGYADQPYRSPIRAREITQLKTGRSLLRVDFQNLFYAAGVQNMTYRLRILKREATYLLAEVVDHDDAPTDRAVCIEPLTASWIRTAVPSIGNRADDLFDAGGMPIGDRFVATFGSTY